MGITCDCIRKTVMKKTDTILRNIHMSEHNLIGFVIGCIIRNAPAYHLKIDGDPLQKWFILRDAHLAHYFSTDSCDIMFKFEADRRVAIFFPEHIGIDFSAEPCVCSLFFEENTTMPGWRQVCPHLTEMVYDVCFEYIPVLIQFVQNPVLCGIHGCDWRVCYFKQMSELCWEIPVDETEEDFECEDNIEKHDKED